MIDTNSVDKVQLTLCLFATLCIAALWTVDIYMAIG